MYNNQRLHLSCDYLTPKQAHQQQGPLGNRWKRKDLKSNSMKGFHALALPAMKKHKRLKMLIVLKAV